MLLRAEIVIHLTAVQALLQVQEAAQALAVVRGRAAVRGVDLAVVLDQVQAVVLVVDRVVAQVLEAAQVLLPAQAVARAHLREAAVPEVVQEAVPAEVVPAPAEVLVQAVAQAVVPVPAVPHLPDQVLHPALLLDRQVHH